MQSAAAWPRSPSKIARRARFGASGASWRYSVRNRTQDGTVNRPTPACVNRDCGTESWVRSPIWQLAAALAAELPAVMLIGAADDSNGSLEFVTNPDMFYNLMRLVDVGDADASVKTDIPLILDEKLPQMLGEKDREAAAAKLNSMAKGCIAGAVRCMNEPEVLQAAVGNTAPLLALPRREMELKMICAGAGGFVEVVRTCLDAGADAKTAYENGVTTLFMAAMGGHQPVVEALLRAGADANAAENDGDTPLLMAAQGGHLPVVEALLRAGADANAANSDGRAPLMFAAQGGHLLVVEALLRAGADLKATTSDGIMALMIVAQLGHLPVAEVLLQAGADANVAVEDGWTALIAAAQGGHPPMAEALLRAGADANAALSDGTTVLMVAAQGGNLSVAEALLRAGADPKATDNDGFTAADIAKDDPAFLQLLQA